MRRIFDASHDERRSIQTIHNTMSEFGEEEENFLYVDPLNDVDDGSNSWVIQTCHDARSHRELLGMLHRESERLQRIIDENVVIVVEKCVFLVNIINDIIPHVIVLNQTKTKRVCDSCISHVHGIMMYYQSLVHRDAIVVNEDKNTDDEAICESYTQQVLKPLQAQLYNIHTLIEVLKTEIRGSVLTLIALQRSESTDHQFQNIE